MSIERQRAILEQQLEEITGGIAELKRNRGENFSIKQLEKSKKSIKQKLDKLNDQTKKDDVVTFEELGVDRLFVDESHYYKNLYLYTKMRNVGGIAQTEVQKSSDLFMKCRYLDEITGGRGTVFATGTPISNSMVELYTIQRYLQYSTLVKNGLQHFDAWASTFGETITAVELTPEGTDRTHLTLVFKLTGATPANTWADAGIYLYDDADNYVALEKKHRGGNTSAVAIVKEQNHEGQETSYSNWANVSDNPIWLKLEKKGANVKAFFSSDKNSWTEIGSRDDCGFLSDSYKLAIASQGTNTGSITYSDVTVNDKEVKLVEEAVKPTASNVTVTYDEAADSLTAAGDTTGQSVIVKWAVADKENGNYSIISGVEGTSLTASKALKGKYVKAAYVPLIGTGAAGDIVWSDAVKVTGNGTDSGASAVKSANADLATADIKTSESTDMFQFVKGTTFYQTTAGSDVQEIKYSFAAEDTKATVKVLVNGKETAELSGNAVLTSGRNLIEVNVTAEDGVTMKKYRFTISRQGDNNALLESMQVNGQTIKLAEGVYEYSLPIATGTTTAQVAATAQSTRATVSIVNVLISTL